MLELLVVRCEWHLRGLSGRTRVAHPNPIQSFVLGFHTRSCFSIASVCLWYKYILIPPPTRDHPPPRAPLHREQRVENFRVS